MELYVCREKLWFHKDLHTDLIINKLTPKMKLLLFFDLTSIVELYD